MTRNNIANDNVYKQQEQLKSQKRQHLLYKTNTNQLKSINCIVTIIQRRFINRMRLNSWKTMFALRVKLNQWKRTTLLKILTILILRTVVQPGKAQGHNHGLNLSTWVIPTQYNHNQLMSNKAQFISAINTMIKRKRKCNAMPIPILLCLVCQN